MYPLINKEPFFHIREHSNSNAIVTCDYNRWKAIVNQNINVSVSALYYINKTAFKVTYRTLSLFTYCLCHVHNTSINDAIKFHIYCTDA